MGDLRILSIEEILAVNDTPTQVIPAPLWGADGAVEIRALSKADIMAINAGATVATPAGGTTIQNDRLEQLMFQKAVVDPPLTLAQVEALWLKSFRAVQPIMLAIYRLNRMDAEAAEEVDAFPGAAPDAAAAGAQAG